MSLFKQVWEKTLKLLKKSQKKDVAALRATFDLTFCQKVRSPCRLPRRALTVA